MATTWPQATAWPNDLREHATYLSNYLKEALLCINSAKDQPVPTPLVKTIITATYSLLMKLDSTPDYNAVMQALMAIHGDVKTTVMTVTDTATAVQPAGSKPIVTYRALRLFDGPSCMPKMPFRAPLLSSNYINTPF